MTACNSGTENTSTGSGDSLSVTADKTGTNQTDTASMTSAVDSQDATFLQEAYAGGLKEVAASEQAKEKSSMKETKDVADMMISAHTEMNNQIKGIATAKKVTVPATLPQADAEQLNSSSAKTGKEFDKAYATALVDDHKKTIALFEKEVKEGKDADVKNLAQMALPDLKKHLEHAEQLVKKTK